MLIVDAHLDLAWNALQWNRDITQSVYTLRTREASTGGKGRAQNTVALPEMRQGRVALCIATTMGRSTGRPVPHVDFDSPEQTCAIAQSHLAYYRALADGGHLRIIEDAPTLTAHIRDWQAWDAQANADEPPPLGILISMESADPILKPEHARQWQQAGVRIIGPAHQGPGRYAGGTGVEGGVTPLGEALLREMSALGIALDLTHLTDRGFWQALDLYQGVVLASHNNCRALVPHQRQFSDAQILAIQARGGVIGIACDTWMLQPGWVKGESRNTGILIDAMADHIDHICQLTGSSAYVGLGTDLDGGYGREQSPADLDTIADLQRLGTILDQRGYTQQDMAAILHQNWLSLLGRVLQASHPAPIRQRGAPHA